VAKISPGGFSRRDLCVQSDTSRDSHKGAGQRSGGRGFTAMARCHGQDDSLLALARA
jgi:hypothetical protein